MSSLPIAAPRFAQALAIRSTALPGRVDTAPARRRTQQLRSLGAFADDYTPGPLAMSNKKAATRHGRELSTIGSRDETNQQSHWARRKTMHTGEGVLSSSPVEVSRPVSWSMRKTTMLFVFWLAASR